MAVSPDVLAAALVDLAPGYSELFTEWSPVLDKIVKGGRKETLQSYQKEFVVVTAGPGTLNQLTGGNEVIAGGLNQTGQRGNEHAPRMVYAFDVSGMMLDEANGEQDVARLISSYPDLAIEDFHERIVQQLVMGNGTNAGGFITWNGQTTYSPKGSARDGVFEFLATGSQDNTVHGLTKNTVAGWYNQYGDITSFASNGRATMRSVYWAAQRQGSKLKGGVDLMFCDPVFYNNYVEDLDEPVRFAPPQNQQGDPAKGNQREGIKFLDAMMYLEEKIDPSGFTGAAADGVCYGINSSTWNAFTVGHGGPTQNKGFFSVRGPFRIPDQELWRYEIVLSMGMWCSNLRANFAITGGDTP